MWWDAVVVPEALDPVEGRPEMAQPVRIIMLMGLLGACLQFLRFQAPAYAIDDSYITFRVARNWVDTGVPTYDTDFPAVEGSTTPLWMLISAAWIRWIPSVDPMVFARVLGAICQLLTTGLLIRLAALIAADHQGSGTRAALAAVVALDSSSWMSFHSVSGMETALFGLLFVAALDRLHVAHRTASQRSAWAAGALLGLLSACRPEGALVTVIAWTAVVLDRRLRPHAWRLLSSSAAMIGAIELWRWLTYHELVPNTFFAKPPSPLEGLRYLERYLFLGTGLVGPLAAAFAVRRSGFARALLLGLVVLTAGLVWSGGDWMPGFRRLLLPALGLTVLVAAGAGIVTGPGRVVVLASLCGWIAGNVVEDRKDRGAEYFDTRGIGSLGKMAQASGLHQVALSDIGAFGWYFRGSVYDMFGLTDRHIAKAEGKAGAKRFDAAYFEERRPEVVIFTSQASTLETAGDLSQVRANEHALAEWLMHDPEYSLRARFPYGTTWYFLVFSRRDISLPESIWGKPGGVRGVLEAHEG